MRKNILTSTASSFAIVALSASALLLAPTAARAGAVVIGSGTSETHTYVGGTDTTVTYSDAANTTAGVLTVNDGTTIGANTITATNGTTLANGVGVANFTVGTTGTTAGSGVGTVGGYLNTINVTGAGSSVAAGNTVAVTGGVYTQNLNIGVETGANLTVSGATTTSALSLANSGHGTFTGAANTATLSLGSGTGATFTGGLTTGTSTSLTGTNIIITGASSTFGATSLTGANSTITATGGGVTNTLSSLSVDGTSSATLNGTGTSAVTGTATVASGGTLSLSSATGNTIGTLAAAAGSTTNVGANTTITTLGTGTGAISVTNGSVLTLGTGASSATGARNFKLTATNNTGTTSKIVGSNNQSINLSGGSLAFNAGSFSPAGAKTVYNVATTSGNGVITGPGSFSVTNGVTGYTYADHVVGQNLDVVDTKNSSYDGASTGSAAAESHNSLASFLQTQIVGGVLDTGSNNVSSYLAELTGASTAAAKSNVLNQAAAQTTTQVANDFATGFMNVVEDRTGVMQGTRTASNQNGLSAGDASMGSAVWMDAFGSVARQDSRGGEAGFDTDNGGFAVGFEQKLSQASTAGLSISYGAGQYQSNDQFAPKTTSSDDYQASLYGSSYVMPNWYVDGQIGGGYHTFDEGNTYLGIGTAHADYHGWGYFGQIGTGYDYHTSTPAIVTPFAKLSYQALDYNGYTESGAGALDRHVGSDTAQTLTGFLGAKVAWSNLVYGQTKFTPELRAAYLHDFEQEGLSTSSNFVGSGSASTFATTGQGLAKDGYTVGLGLNVARTNGWNFDANYVYEGRDGYNGHSGTIQAKYAF